MSNCEEKATISPDRCKGIRAEGSLLIVFYPHSANAVSVGFVHGAIRLCCVGLVLSAAEEGDLHNSIRDKTIVNSVIDQSKQ